MGALERVLDQVLGSLRLRDASVELRDLPLGQSIEASMVPAAAGEQPADLPESEPCALEQADQRDPIRARRRVVPTPAGTLCG